MQERIREKIQKTFHSSIPGNVNKWLELTLDEAPLDVNMNSAEIESIVSQRDSKTDTIKSPVVDEVKEESEVNAIDVSIKDVGKVSKDQSTDVAN